MLQLSISCDSDSTNQLSPDVACFSPFHYGLASVSILSSLLLVLSAAMHKRMVYSQRLSSSSPFSSLTNTNGIMVHFYRTFLLVYQFYVPRVSPEFPKTLELLQLAVVRSHIHIGRGGLVLGPNAAGHHV